MTTKNTCCYLLQMSLTLCSFTFFWIDLSGSRIPLSLWILKRLLSANFTVSGSCKGLFTYGHFQYVSRLQIEKCGTKIAKYFIEEATESNKNGYLAENNNYNIVRCYIRWIFIAVLWPIYVKFFVTTLKKVHMNKFAGKTYFVSQPESLVYSSEPLFTIICKV